MRSSAKRQRERSSAQAGRQSNQPPASQRSRLITGQSSAVASGLWAAKTIAKKAVVCVDNVSLACNEDDIRAYVSKQGIEVFTCFKTNPRRRTNETAEDVSDRKAFRLCINAADRDRIFNPDGQRQYVSRTGSSVTRTTAVITTRNDDVSMTQLSVESLRLRVVLLVTSHIKVVQWSTRTT